jgi:hypothetical protein
MSKANVVRAIQSLRDKIFEHERKIADIQYEGGFTSSLERELRTFQEQLAELESLLNNYEWKFCEKHKGWADFLNHRCEECGEQDW